MNGLPFNWFDLVFLVVLFFGLRIGRKHGMSDELPALLKWLAIALGCAFVYQPLGKIIVSRSSVFSELDAYLMAYVATALVIAAIFSVLKSALGEKWVSAEFFGGSEFYLGMISGCIRAACILIAVLALLNARSYNTAEVNAAIRYQKEVYGSNFFPTLQTIQAQVFERSMIGPTIKRDMAFLLIKPTRPEKKQLKRKETQLP
jgi:uncharacterized membrane protein required for colicin V production